MFRAPAEEPREVASPPTVPKVDFGNPSLGSPDANLTIVVFGDYQCTSCATFDLTVQEILLEFPDDIRIIWKDIPNTKLHPESRNAALAARCAGEQGAFWYYHNLLMGRQSSLSESNYPVFALELGLDGELFTTCLQERRPDRLIQRDIDEAISLGINATPYVYIGNQPNAGSIRKDRLELMVEAALESAPTHTPAN
ncbi:MAG: thioredoxin domain-containing protein [Planctomycetota bacterium]|nr:thioredoxin domain-containing protein [Planctomycetota bacterium]